MFNHQARWDRELPQEENSQVKQRIEVFCFFAQKGGLEPLAFVWSQRTLHIQKINFCWKDKRGQDTLLFFSVQTEGGTFEILFSKVSLSWHMHQLTGP